MIINFLLFIRAEWRGMSPLIAELTHITCTDHGPGLAEDFQIKWGNMELDNYTQVLSLCVFVGLVKIRMSQIHSTKVINNQKHMSEGTPA